MGSLSAEPHMTQIRHYTFTILITIAIILLSVIPITESTPLDDVPFIDKWVHMVMYAGLSFVMWVDMRCYKRCPTVLPYAIIIAYSTLLGGILELVQTYCTTCRSGEWLDFLADSFGALICSVCCYIASFIWQKRISAQR